jgi:hypothetical protein
MATVSFGGENNTLKLMVMETQVCKYTKDQLTIQFKRANQ